MFPSGAPLRPHSSLFSYLLRVASSEQQSSVPPLQHVRLSLAAFSVFMSRYVLLSHFRIPLVLFVTYCCSSSVRGWLVCRVVVIRYVGVIFAHVP